MAFNDFIKETEDIATPRPPTTQKDSPFANWYSGDEDSTRLTMAMDKGSETPPDTAARVRKLQMKTGLPEDVISRNIDTVEREALKSDFNAERFRKESPIVAQWMSEGPQNASLVHDDIDNITAHEKAIQDHGFYDTMYRSLNHGLSTLGAQAARLPALASDLSNLRYNLGVKLIGRPELQIRSPKVLSDNAATQFFEDRAQRFMVPELEQSITKHLSDGEFRMAGRTMAAQFMSNAPQQAAIIVAGLTGAGLPALFGAGALQASGVAQEARQRGADPAMATVDAAVQGTVEAGFESIGTFGILKHWEGQIAKNFGKGTAREVMKDFAKTMFATGVGEGNEEFLTQIAQDFSDYITGVNPDALTGTFQRAADAGLIGSASGIAMTSPSAITSGIIRSQNERRVNRAKDLYVALGATAEASKLRERLPEAHKEIVERMTKDGPIENVYVPASTIQEFFQSRNEDPAPLMSKVGALDSYLEAKNSGGDVRIPMADWVNKVVGTEYYQAFQDDIKFSPTDQSVNDVKQAKELLAQEEEARKAETQVQEAQPDPAVELAGSVASQLQAAGFDESTAETYSKIYESAFRTIGEKAGINPMELFKRYGLQIKRQELQPAAEGQTQALQQEAKPEPLPVYSDEPKTGDPVAVFNFNWKLDESQPATPYFRIFGDPGVISSKLNIGWRSDLPYSKVIEAGIPIVGKMQSATEEPDLPRPSVQQPTQQGQQAQTGTQTANEALRDSVFPVGSSTESIASDPDFIKLRTDASEIVDQYAKQRGIEPSQQFAKSLWQELHDALGDVRKAPPSERMAVAQQVMQNYPNIEADFVTLRDVLYTIEDTTGEQISYNAFVKGKYQPRHEETFYQSAPNAPTFFSAVEKTISEKLPAKASPDQVIGMLKNSPGVKQEELDWIGLPEFLQGKKSVTKEEVQQFIKENNVQIEEFTKSSENAAKDKERIKELQDQMHEIRAEAFDGLKQVDAANAANWATEEFEGNAEAGKLIDKLGVPEKQRDLISQYGKLRSERGRLEFKKQSLPKFSNYVLPGGENYRELLLTLPTTEEETIGKDGEFEYFIDGRFIGRGGEDGIRATVEALRNNPANSGLNITMAPTRKMVVNKGFVSEHFDEPNILAHVRFNDRVDADGKKVLFLEEVQSDWHQTGRSEGYKRDWDALYEESAQLRREIEKITELVDGHKELPGHKIVAYAGRESRQVTPENADKFEELNNKRSAIDQELQKATRGGVPDAPFKKTWHELALKRMLRYAAENGYDKVAWTTGEQQAERYDLSKQVDKITVVDLSKNKGVAGDKGFMLIAQKDGGNVLEQFIDDKSKLQDYVGKDAARKLTEQPVDESGKQSISGDDLKVGGEGMKGFYDQIIPSFLNKYTKKWGGKVGETTLGDLVRGEDGLKQKSPSEPIRTDMGMVAEKVHSLDITPAMKDSVLGQGQALFQGAEKTPRGMIRFGNDRQFNIDLLKDADLSTFLHETGHFYLEILGDVATAENANEQLKADYKEALKFLGVDSREKIGREQHEQWARAFEAYLLEGKAPSSQLRQAFNRFRAWLISVYQKIQSLKVELNPEIRGVFDRLLASDVEIKAAEREQGISPLFGNPADFGLTEKEAESYNKAVLEAHNAAEEELASQLMAEVQRTKTKAWNDTRQAIIDEITPEVNARKEYIALDVLQSKEETTTDYGIKTFKLDKAALVKEFPQYELKRFPRPVIYSAENGVHPQIAAEMFGFKSAEEMLFALYTSPKKQDFINEIADERMKELHGDMLTDGSLPVKAMRAVHNNKRSELLRKELQFLASENLASLKGIVRRVAKRIPTIESVRAQAEQTIASKKVRDIQPVIYQRAESKARNRALEFLLKGDIEQAFIEKQRELLNHELYKAADSAKQETENIVDFMGRFSKTSTRERIGKAGADYLDQIDLILDRYDFRKGQTLKAIDRKKSLIQWVSDQRAAGYDVTIPENILLEVQRQSYKEIPYEQLLGVRDSVKSIEHLARVKNQLLENEKHRELTAAREELIASLAANHDLKAEPHEFAPSLGKKLLKDVKKAISAHTRMEFLFEYMDGGKPHGTAWETFFKPVAQAEDMETKMMRESTKVITEIFDVYSRKERALWFYKKTLIPEINASLTKGNMMAVALNWGNEYNRQALMEGYGWSETQVQAILDNLDERDWKTVQAVWDHIDSYWPQAQALEKSINGTAPDKVEASEVKTKFGTFKGGYYPIAFDADQSYRQAQLDERSSVSELFGGNWARAMTRHGHLENRVGTGGKPLLLNLSPMTTHIMNVVHDISHRKAVIDLSKLINDKEIREAIEAAVGKEMYRELNPWIVSIAGDRRQEPFGFIEKIASRARMGATTVNLGWKISSAAVQVLGYTISAKELGAKYASIGIQSIMGPKKISDSWAFITERSEMMRNRMTSYDRDVRDASKRLNITAETSSPLAVVDTYTADLTRSYFKFVGFMDLATSVPTWIGAYQKGMDGAVENISKGDEKAAVEYADSVVRKTQSAGGAKDLASIQRGSELHKLFTMFYSQLSLIFNQFQNVYQQFRVDRNVPNLMASAALIWFIPAVLEDVLRGQAPGGDDDKEKWLKWLAKKEVFYPFQSIVLVRDMVSAMDYDYSMSPAANALGSLAKTTKAIGNRTLGDKDEFTQSDFKNMFNTVGYFAGLPTRQTWQTLEYAYEWMTGEQQPSNPVEGVWRMLLAGKKR